MKFHSMSLAATHIFAGPVMQSSFSLLSQGKFIFLFQHAISCQKCATFPDLIKKLIVVVRVEGRKLSQLVTFFKKIWKEGRFTKKQSLMNLCSFRPPESLPRTEVKQAQLTLRQSCSCYFHFQRKNNFPDFSLFAVCCIFPPWSEHTIAGEEERRRISCSLPRHFPPSGNNWKQLKLFSYKDKDLMKCLSFSQLWTMDDKLCMKNSLINSAIFHVSLPFRRRRKLMSCEHVSFVLRDYFSCRRVRYQNEKWVDEKLCEKSNWFHAESMPAIRETKIILELVVSVWTANIV